VLEHAEQVLGIEAMCAAQASDLRGHDHAMAPALRELQDAFRQDVPFLERDAVMAPLMASAAAWIRTGAPGEKADLRDAQS
ncbi:MAG TPA: histidine ammonia-lyase, partial [Flavobacteriales bacterium]|nr:histidine ammonia-lyase [Flavobacteriales bacterium]